MKKIPVLLLIGCMLLTMCGCGGSSEYAADNMAADSAPMESYGDQNMGGGYYAEDVVMEEAKEDWDWKETITTQTGKETTKTQGQRKLIKTVNLEVETKEFDQVMLTLEEQVTAMGGYIESMETYNGSTYSGYRNSRDASLTIRIPKDELETFLNNISDISNVIRRSENVDDVTLEYVDIESRRNALRTEQERLLELLAIAETVDEIILIEDRLSNVRYQLESMESQLRTYDNKVDYSTVYLNVGEVKELTPVQEKTVWQRISGGFVESLEDIGNDFVELSIWFLVHIPYLVIWAVVIAIAVPIMKKVREKRRVRKQNEKQSD